MNVIQQWIESFFFHYLISGEPHIIQMDETTYRASDSTDSQFVVSQCIGLLKKIHNYVNKNPEMFPEDINMTLSQLSI